MIQAYTAPSPATRVIYIHYIYIHYIQERRPIAIKTDPGAEWTARPGRACYEPEKQRASRRFYLLEYCLEDVPET